MSNLGEKRKFLFYTELAKLVEAGFGIREAVGVMLESGPGAAERRMLDAVLNGLNAGKSIAGSFEEGALTRMERGIIEAGERSGKLAPAFQHLADYFELLEGARRDALKAMVYPLILLHLGLLVAVIPSDVMGQGLNTPGLLGKLVMLILCTYTVIALITVLVMWLLKLAPNNAAVDRMINAVPVIGAARKNLAMARFTKVYHAALVAGISMVETAEMAGEASNSGSIREAAGKMQDAVKEGRNLGPVMVAERAFPRAFSKSYATAEASGMLDKDLARWAKVFQDAAASGVKMLAVVLPKAGYVLVVGFVVWKLLSFFSGYYGSMENIGI